ncbi:DUF397 domain-containing protein [Streptomyces sp. RB6PN25]|uniref:DUF397 domain-containing protein n=1 Tax=Streptomyces humicola TaxID=2953240 RepID=A0ABT1PV60_9ACTN|nr:DUF397 domain-containing protein [Streptomyces humicola]MCQ4081556.1 DUF397 domain-containing protein [Streptomyces humicola]
MLEHVGDQLRDGELGGVRELKNSDGPVLTLVPAAFAAFVSAAVAGTFTRPDWS